MKHLDERISDLVDDRLDHDERDRALVHLTVCAACREAAELERHAKNALRSLPDAVPSERLIQSLRALAEPAGPLPPRQPATSVPAPVAAWRPRDSRPRSGPAGGTSSSGPNRGSRSDRGRGRAMRVFALGTGSTAAVLLLLASLGGSPNPPGSDQAPASIVPPLEQFTVEHARSTGGLPFVQPASLLVTNLGTLGDGW